MDPALYSRIKQAVLEQCQTVNLSGLGVPGGVHSQMFPDVTGLTCPAVSVWSAKLPQTAGEVASSKTEDGWFRVGVSVVDQLPIRHDRESIYTTGRAALMEVFKTPAGGRFRLPGVTEVMRCRIEPGPMFDERIPTYQHVRTDFVLAFYVMALR